MEPISAILNLGGKILDKVLPNPEAKAAALLELERLHQTGELAEMQNNTELFKAEVDDRKSARKIHTNFVDILALGVLGGAGYGLYYVLSNGVSKDLDNMTAGMIIQVGITAITMVLGYYFGSSSSSNKKTDAMVRAISK